jgi:hypothetical protein
MPIVSLAMYLVVALLAAAAIRYFFPWVDLLRVPLTFGAIFVLFPWLATSGPIKAFGKGMFEVSKWDIWQIALAALMTAASLLVCTDIVVSYGGERMAGIPDLPAFLSREVVSAPISLSLLSTALGAIYFAGAVYYLVKLEPLGGWGGGSILEVALGTGLFALLAYALVALSGNEWLGNLVRSVVEFLATPGGYIDPNTGKVYRSHVIAAILATVAALVYIAFGYWRYRAIEINRTITTKQAEAATDVPTLAWVIFLVLVSCWILSGMAYWMDARRIPLLLPLGVLFGLCAYFFARTDHIFHTRQDGYNPATARELIRTLPDGADPNAIVLVAASGGGIQAAAWTATVLEELVKAFPGRFAKQVRLVSGVSGGSVGLMYYVAAYEGGDIAHPKLSQSVLGDDNTGDPLFRLAASPSLDNVAWGLAFPDFFRSWLPIVFPQGVDRAWALSRAWVRYQGVGNLKKATLGAWSTDAAKGARPPACFNATLAEIGARYLLPTFRLENKLFGRRELATDLPGHDLDVPIAARLSAAFPYVSPASRPATKCGDNPCGHLVDGGYYDNYGIATAVDYLREALPDAKGRRVLLLHIEAGRFGDKSVTSTQRGWFYQVFAPPQGLLGVWDTGMRSRNDVEIALMGEVIRARGGQFNSVRVDFPADETPTSWYLTRKDKDDPRFGSWRAPGGVAGRTDRG